MVGQHFLARLMESHIREQFQILLFAKNPEPRYTLARTVVAHLSGHELTFTGAEMSTKLKLMGVDAASIGDAHAKTPGVLVYTYQDGRAEINKRLIV